MKFHNLFFSVVSAACSAPLLGNSKATCNGKNESDYIVDYGVNGSTITLCIQNAVDDGWIALGPGEGMLGTVVGCWGNDTTSSFDLINNATHDIVGDSSNLSALNINCEVKDDGKRCLCFDFPDDKISGTMETAKFQWACAESGVALEANGTKHAAKGTFVLNLTSLVVPNVTEGAEGGAGEPNVNCPTCPVCPTCNTSCPECPKCETNASSLNLGFLEKTEVKVAGACIVAFLVVSAFGCCCCICSQNRKLAEGQRRALNQARIAEDQHRRANQALAMGGARIPGRSAPRRGRR